MDPGLFWRNFERKRLTRGREILPVPFLAMADECCFDIFSTDMANIKSLRSYEAACSVNHRCCMLYAYYLAEEFGPFWSPIELSNTSKCHSRSRPCLRHSRSSRLLSNKDAIHVRGARVPHHDLGRDFCANTSCLDRDQSRPITSFDPVSFFNRKPLDFHNLNAHGNPLSRSPRCLWRRCPPPITLPHRTGGERTLQTQ